MSSFKKMKLVNADDNNESNNQQDIFNIIKQQAPVTIKRAVDLDKEIKTILSNDVDDDTKAKLYSNALRRFLTFKGQYENQLEQLKQLAPSIKAKTSKKKNKKKTPKKRIWQTPIRTVKKTPKKTKKKKKTKPTATQVVPDNTGFIAGPSTSQLTGGPRQQQTAPKTRIPKSPEVKIISENLVQPTSRRPTRKVTSGVSNIMNVLSQRDRFAVEPTPDVDNEGNLIWYDFENE